MVFAGFNWFLIIITAVLGLLSIAVALYLLISYQHPEDKNQAWFPKIAVVFGITLSIWTILLFPIDVANTQACSDSLAFTTCDLALPTTTLWYICYIAAAVMAFFVCPFALYYYEADSDVSFAKRLISALSWVAVTAVVLALILGICYGLWGYVEYPVMGLASGLAPFSAISNSTQPLNRCIEVLSGGGASPIYGGRNCDAINGGLPTYTWKIRISFVVYVIAVVTTIGWLLFMVFCGAGLVALPLDMIREFLGRPKACITKSEYMTRAKALGNKAKGIMESAAKLRKEDREVGRGRKWRTNYRLLNQEVLVLEEEEKQLDRVYPQSTDPDYAWAITVITFWLKGLFGVVGVVLSICWLLQILLYIFVYPPVTPFLNTLFTDLNSAFPLFGTVAFGIFCFYLIGCVIKGATKVGLNLLVFTVHPMKVGATLMSSFLFNVAMVLLATQAAIQFCAQAFELYANNSAIQKIWGGQITYVMGLKYLYRLHVFYYSLFAFVGLTAAYLLIRGPERWKRYKVEDAYVV